MAVESDAFVNALKGSLPQCIKTNEDGLEVLTIMGAVVVNALKNRDSVYLQGIGEWRSELDKGKKKVIFTPDRVLIEAINE